MCGKCLSFPIKKENPFINLSTSIYLCFAWYTSINKHPSATYVPHASKAIWESKLSLKNTNRIAYNQENL